MVYKVFRGSDEINRIEINPEQVESYESLTGLSLEPVVCPVPDPSNGAAWAEEYVNLLDETLASENGLEGA